YFHESAAVWTCDTVCPADWSRSFRPLAAQAEFAWSRAPVSLVLLMTPGGPFTSPASAAPALSVRTSNAPQAALRSRRDTGISFSARGRSRHSHAARCGRPQLGRRAGGTSPERPCFLFVPRECQRRL